MYTYVKQGQILNKEEEEEVSNNPRESRTT